MELDIKYLIEYILSKDIPVEASNTAILAIVHMRNNKQLSGTRSLMDAFAWDRTPQGMSFWYGVKYAPTRRY